MSDSMIHLIPRTTELPPEEQARIQAQVVAQRNQEAAEREIRLCIEAIRHNIQVMLDNQQPGEIPEQITAGMIGRAYRDIQKLEAQK